MMKNQLVGLNKVCWKPKNLHIYGVFVHTGCLFVEKYLPI